jgi:hypothetical protein
LALVFAASACGTSSPAPSSSQQAPNLLRASDLSRYPAGSVERSFLEYWSSLQFQSWADVAAYYDPRFRDYVGTALVIGAKKLNGSLYPLLDPKIVRATSEDGETTINYTLQMADGSKELSSITWRRDDGNWQIVYDSRLDAELQQFAQNRAEIERVGALPTDSSQPASSRAARAGSEAAQLQARFLEEELKAKAP